MKVLSMLLTVVFWSSWVSASDPYWKQGATDKVHSVTVWRSESCGCCKAWITHLKEHNFHVIDQPIEEMTALKDRLAVPNQLRSCHTAQVDGLTVEGHVPAQDIKAILSSMSSARILAVPGMPSGSPGMDMPGARKDDFPVVAVTPDGMFEYNRYQGY